MKNKKVVLYFPRVFSDTRPWHGTPLALLAVSGLLANEGYDVRIVADFLFNKHIEEVVHQCQDSICLGLTCMTGFQIYDALRIADAVRASRPDLPIVWGGWHPSILPEETVQDERVDIVIRGQGERKFAEVVRCLSEHAALDGIPGVTYKRHDGSIASSPDCVLENINNFPSYPYRLVQVEKCLDTTEYGQRMIHYISSYGCPYNCGFCIEPVVNRRRWTGLSAQRVVSDWEHLYKQYRIDSIAVYDSNFFVDKDRVYEICTGLLKKNIKIKWGNANGNISRLITYEPEIWEVMERSGCQLIMTGAESSEQEVLDLINKDANVKDIYEFTRLCNKYNIRAMFSYMSGVPWSNNPEFNEQRVNQEINSILSQVDKLLTVTKKDRFMVYTYSPWPGSKMYQTAIEYGFREPKTLCE